MKRTSDQILTEWLVLQIQSGNNRARDRLAGLWHPLLYRYALRQLRNTEDSRDVVQDTFITVFGRIHALRDPAAFPKWVYTILHRRCADLIRQRSRMQARHENAVTRDEGDEASYVPDHATGMDIASAMARLSRESYVAVHLHYLHGFGLQDIADISAVPVGTVKSRLFNARKSLQRNLGGYDEQVGRKDSRSTQ